MRRHRWNTFARLVGLVLLVAATASPAAGPKVLYYGFSQSGQGFCGVGKNIETILMENECPDAVHIDGLEIVGVTKGGAAIELWKNPQYAGYDFDTYHLPRPTALTIARDEANFLVLNVSGSPRTVAAWASDIRDAVATMKALHPFAQRIYLQPVSTGPLDAAGVPVPCMNGSTLVRAVSNHPDIVAAIAQVVAEDAMVEAGLVPASATAISSPIRAAISMTTAEQSKSAGKSNRSMPARCSIRSSAYRRWRRQV